MGRKKTALKIKFQCFRCEKEFERKESQIKYNIKDHYFCSPTCFREWLAEFNKVKISQCLTHAEIIGKLTDYCKERKWEKATVHTIKKKFFFDYAFHPDVIYESNNTKFILTAEIKPEFNSRKEVFAGIGQCLCNMLFENTKTYLVIHKKFIPILEPFFERYLFWLGIISFDENETFKIEKRGEISNYKKINNFSSSLEDEDKILVVGAKSSCCDDEIIFLWDKDIFCCRQCGKKIFIPDKSVL